MEIIIIGILIIELIGIPLPIVLQEEYYSIQSLILYVFSRLTPRWELRISDG